MENAAAKLQTVAAGVVSPPRPPRHTADSATSLPLGTDTRTRHCPGGPSLPPFSGAGLQPLLQLMPGWGTLFPVSFPGPAVPGWASYPIPRTQSLGLPDPHQLPSLLHLLVDTLTRTAPGRPHRPPSYLGWNLACAWSASSRTVCGCLCTCGAGYARCDCACTCGGVGPLFPKPPPPPRHTVLPYQLLPLSWRMRRCRTDGGSGVPSWAAQLCVYCSAVHPLEAFPMPSSLTLRVVNQSISWTRPLSNSSPSGSRKDWRVVARPSAAPPRPCSGCGCSVMALVDPSCTRTRTPFPQRPASSGTLALCPRSVVPLCMVWCRVRVYFELCCAHEE